MDDTLDTLGKAVAAALPSSVTGYAVAYHELNVTVEARDVVGVRQHVLVHDLYRDGPACEPLVVR